MFDQATHQAASLDTYDLCMKSAQLQAPTNSGTTAVFTFENGALVAKYLRETTTRSPDGGQSHIVDGAAPEVAPRQAAMVKPRQ